MQYVLPGQYAVEVLLHTEAVESASFRRISAVGVQEGSYVVLPTPTLRFEVGSLSPHPGLKSGSCPEIWQNPPRSPKRRQSRMYTRGDD